MRSCVLENQIFSILGDGKQIRDYIYVTDTVRAVLDLYKHFRANGLVVNVGSGQELSVVDLKIKIERILGQEVPCQYLDPRPGDVRRHRADITLLKSLIDFEPEISIDEGLARTVEFYRGHLNRSRSGA
jgi:UDP-glucose 4-epimerase